MEQGELEASPYHSPYLDIGVYGDRLSDEGGETRHRRSPRPDDHDEEELGPDIKPPQAKVKKEKHKHKHKRDKRKSGERERHGERGEKGRGKSSGSFPPPKHRGAPASSVSRSSGKDRRERPGKEVTDRDRRARPQMPQRNREEEMMRREWSLKERERLEQLEMERIRLERLREQEHHDKLRYERERGAKERRAATRQDVGKRRDREKVGNSGRSRSPYQRRGPEGQQKGERQRQRDHYRHAEEPPRPSQPHPSRREPMDERRSEGEGHMEEEREEEEVRHDQEAIESVEQQEVESSEDSESDSEDSSSGDQSESESSSEENEEEEDREENNHPTSHPEKMKSRFDSESEPEPEPDMSDSGPHSEEENPHYLDDSPVPSPPELLPLLPPYYPAIQGCRNVDEFSCLNRIEEGTYGVVYRAMDKKTKEVVALKRLKMEKEKEGFPITSLREINTLLKAQHSNIVHVREIVVGSNMDRIYIVMDYVEHDLKALMETMKEPFIVGEVKTLMIQLLRGVAHLHDNWIIHRDLKTSNLLLSHTGILKIGDFGLAREYGSPLKPYTPIVVTLWYRAPELLLGTKEYSCPIDMWSVGCIMAEFLTRKPLFPGKSEIDELNRIFKELGTPNEKIWQGVSELKGWKTCNFTEYPYNQLRNKFGGILTDTGFELINRFLTYNPQKRITAIEGLEHEWFKESPRPVNPSMFPTWPAKSEQTHRKSHGNSPKPPSGGKAYNQLLADEDEKILGLVAAGGGGTGGGGGFHLGGNTKTEGGGFSLKF